MYICGGCSLTVPFTAVPPSSVQEQVNTTFLTKSCGEMLMGLNMWV